jgi:hypothetical protein
MTDNAERAAHLNDTHIAPPRDYLSKPAGALEDALEAMSSLDTLCSMYNLDPAEVRNLLASPRSVQDPRVLQLTQQWTLTHVLRELRAGHQEGLRRIQTLEKHCANVMEGTAVACRPLANLETKLDKALRDIKIWALGAMCTVTFALLLLLLGIVLKG